MRKVVFVLTVLPLIAAGSPVLYTITDLGSPAGTTVYPYGMNNSGTIVGQLQDPDGTPHAWVWSNGQFSFLAGLVSGAPTTAFDVNSSGAIVGFSNAGSTNSHAVRWDNGVPTDIGGFGGCCVEGYRINDSGIIIGYAETADGSAVPGYRYDGTMHSIGNLANGKYEEPRGINAAGKIVGWSYLNGFSGASHAFLYDTGPNEIDLGGLNGGNSAATAINSSNVIVGMSQVGPGGPRHAFSMPINGTMQDLGAGPWVETRANSINSGGVIVGWAYDANQTNQRGVLYNNGVWIDLNTLIDPNSGWYIIEGSVINDSGQIAARGLFNGAERGILLNPVPEPATALLLALPLAWIALCRRNPNAG